MARLRNFIIAAVCMAFWWWKDVVVSGMVRSKEVVWWLEGGDGGAGLETALTEEPHDDMFLSRGDGAGRPVMPDRREKGLRLKSRH